MNSLAERAIRLVLWAYPAEFRREFGPEMLQVARDRCRFERRSAWRVVVSEACDAVRAAPSIRWEYAMHRIVMLAILGGFAVTAVLVTKLALIPLLAVAILAAWLWARNRRPIAPAVAERRWAAVLAGGIVGIGIAIAIPAIDGDELSGFWWTVMAVAGVAGTIAVIRSWRTGDEQSSPPDRRHHAVLSHRRVSRFSSVPCSRAIGGPVEDDWHCGLSRNDRGRRYPEVPRLAAPPRCRTTWKAVRCPSRTMEAPEADRQRRGARCSWSMGRALGSSTRRAAPAGPLLGECDADRHTRTRRAVDA